MGRRRFSRAGNGILQASAQPPRASADSVGSLRLRASLAALIITPRELIIAVSAPVHNIIPKPPQTAKHNRMPSVHIPQPPLAALVEVGNGTTLAPTDSSKTDVNRSGISGILRNVEISTQGRATHMSDAFHDLEALMVKAKDMVCLVADLKGLAAEIIWAVEGDGDICRDDKACAIRGGGGRR
ncbi:hypothetical protein C8R44DRAFT_863475 [Mycena epipterygia]|nr:hypothetical protein C8R44DRAFT_863475 [Mycena epipterygia]